MVAGGASKTEKQEANWLQCTKSGISKNRKSTGLIVFSQSANT